MRDYLFTDQEKLIEKATSEWLIQKLAELGDELISKMGRDDSIGDVFGIINASLMMVSELVKRSCNEDNNTEFPFGLFKIKTINEEFNAVSSALSHRLLEEYVYITYEKDFIKMHIEKFSKDTMFKEKPEMLLKAAKYVLMLAGIMEFQETSEEEYIEYSKQTDPSILDKVNEYVGLEE